jgi:hypothetical protein
MTSNVQKIAFDWLGCAKSKSTEFHVLCSCFTLDFTLREWNFTVVSEHKTQGDSRPEVNSHLMWLDCTKNSDLNKSEIMRQKHLQKFTWRYNIVALLDFASSMFTILKCVFCRHNPNNDQLCVELRNELTHYNYADEVVFRMITVTD